VEAVEELRRKERELRARQPVQRCGVDGCEFQTKIKTNLKRHEATVHGIGDVDAEELRRKERERDRKRRRQSGESEDEMDPNEEEGDEDEVATVAPRSLRSSAPRSLRSKPTVNYAALAGSDDSDAKDSDDERETAARCQTEKSARAPVPPAPAPPAPPPAPDPPAAPEHRCCEAGCGFRGWTRWDLDEHTESVHNCIDI
jgi:hypothetical protein